MTLAVAPIKRASYSRIQMFNSCKLRAHIQYVQKIPEPERPLPPGKKEHANDRGTRLHDNAEHYVRGNIDELAPEWKAFTTEIDKMRRLFTAGQVSLEGEWGMDADWQATGYNDADVYMRLKLDSIVFLSPTEAVVIDYKSGRRFGNEIKHAEQTQLYQLCAFLRYPKLERITTELWYIDQDELISQEYTRNQGLRFKNKFDKQAKAMTSCTEFPANPNTFSCKWCPYGTRKAYSTGHCQREA